MIPRLKDILETLDRMAPFSNAEDWDNSGLQVGSLSQEITKILVSLDPTPVSLREASERRAQMLLTHHPLIFGSLFRIDRDAYPGNVISEALGSGISVVSAHTSLDVARGGINDMLADLFGLQGVEVLEKRDVPLSGDLGLGRVGDLRKPVSLSVLAKTAKQVLGVERVRISGRKDSRLCRVAVVGGSGGAMVPLASRRGADILITGDIGHHDARTAEELGLSLIDGGHFFTEKAALHLFADGFVGMLRKEGWDVSLEKYKDERPPMWPG